MSRKLRAYHTSTGKVIREIPFYRVTYSPKLEKDVQDVWFTDLFRVGDDIWARDEKGRIYKMMLKTLKPRRNRHTTPEEFADLKKHSAPKPNAPDSSDEER